MPRGSSRSRWGSQARLKHTNCGSRLCPRRSSHVGRGRICRAGVCRLVLGSCKRKRPGNLHAVFCGGFNPDLRPVTDYAWIDAALTSARPQAVAALLRYFRDLDTAEEAFQEASLRALKTWPVKGP